jgi:hypothetical protein
LKALEELKEKEILSKCTFMPNKEKKNEEIPTKINN